jgi:hypothetical protein
MGTMVTELINTIINDYGVALPRSRILKRINWRQQQLFANNLAMSTLLLPTSAFPFPYLKTTAGTLKYDINSSNLVDDNGTAVIPSIAGVPVDIVKVTRVFIKAVNRHAIYYTRTFYGDEFVWLGKNPFVSGDLSKILFLEIPVRKFDQTDAYDAYIVFNEDPGETTNAYYIECMMRPIELDEESKPLTVDGIDWNQALIDGVVGEYEAAKFGSSHRLDKFEKYWVPQYQYKANMGATIDNPCTTPREC